MSDMQYKIMFDGELMPEMSLDTVKQNLARLFKTDAQQIDALFGRGPVALKRALPEAQADRYLSALRQAGVAVRKEQDFSSSLTLEPIAGTASETPADATDSVPMECPKCGHRQPKAAECSACGIIIEKYLARQAQLAAAPPAADPLSPYAPPQSSVGDVPPEFGELKVFTTEGRIGRLRYLAWSLAMLLVVGGLFAFAGIFMAMSSTLGFVLMGLIGIATLVVSVQIGVQRLHDIGWSGWLYLLNLVPFVGSVFPLLMLAIPGNDGANRFGPPPPPNSTAVKVLAWLWLLVIVGGIAAAIAIPALHS